MAITKKVAPKKPKAIVAPPPVVPRLPTVPRRKGLSVLVENGRVHIRHMGDNTPSEPVRYWAELPADITAADLSKPVWNQIAKLGEFRGHAAGPFSLTGQIFDEIIRNFAEIDGSRIAFDFEHASEQDPSDGSIPSEGAPAQGWITQLENRGSDGLWGLVEWLEPARTYIKEKKYRGVSPAIRFNARHPVSGKNIGARLTSAALTNKPFLRGMAPLAARDDGSPQEVVQMGTFCYTANEYMPVLRAAMGLSPVATAREMSEHMARLREIYAAAGCNATAVLDGVDLGAAFKELRNALGMSFSSTYEEMFEIVEELIEEALENHVREFHPGQEPTESEFSDPKGPSPEGATMSDTVALSEAQGKIRNLEAQLLSDKQASEAKTAELNLQLSEARGKAEAAERELVTLRAEKAEREQADRVARVDEAFDTYKDQKHLSDADKESMMIVLIHNPGAFEKSYPRVSASERHLMRDLSGANEKPSDSPAIPPVTTQQSNLSAKGGEEMILLAANALAKEKGITLEDALVRVVASASKG